MILRQGDQVKLGELYRDTVHGRKGIAVAQCRYLSGCDHVGLERLDKDGKLEEFWIDILVAELAVDEPAESVPPAKRTGGPQAHPPTRGRK